MNDMNNILEVTETFVSLQGEGLFTGVPCFFIRLSRCNLRCSYCDTEYAKAPGERKLIEDLLEEWRRSRVSFVQITGGEPLLQNGVYSLMTRLKKKGAIVLLETNGSISLKDVPIGIYKCVDRKCPGSGEVGAWLPENLGFLGRTDSVKFVITNRNDYEWAREEVMRQGLSRFTNPIFSPVWGELSPTDLADWIVEDRIPVRLGLQMHKILWKEARGR